MPSVLATILPVFLLIFFGYWLRHSLLPREFWPPAERLIYFLLLPALLVTTLASADYGDLNVWPMAAALLIALLLMTALLVGLRPLLALNGPVFTSIAQGALRQNTYIGLAVALALFGTPGLAAAAVAVAVIVPAVNVLCVVLLIRYGEGVRPTLGGAALETARNPLILACTIGIALNATGLGLPPVLGPTLEILGSAALPLGLLAVGAGLDFLAFRDAGGPVAVAAALKLAVLPILTAAACRVFGVDGIAAAVAVLFSALPTAASSYILARQLGGDAGLMSGIITVETALAIATLPAIVAWYA